MRRARGEARVRRARGDARVRKARASRTGKQSGPAIVRTTAGPLELCGEKTKTRTCATPACRRPHHPPHVPTPPQHTSPPEPQAAPTLSRSAPHGSRVMVPARRASFPKLPTAPPFASRRLGDVRAPPSAPHPAHPLLTARHPQPAAPFPPLHPPDSQPPPHPATRPPPSSPLQSRGTHHPTHLNAPLRYAVARRASPPSPFPHPSDDGATTRNGCRARIPFPLRWKKPDRRNDASSTHSQP